MPVREPQDMPDTMSDRMPGSILDGMREDGPVLNAGQYWYALLAAYV